MAERSSTLRLVIDSSDARRAANDLDRFGDEAKRAEKQVDRLGDRSSRAERELRGMGTAAVRIGTQLAAAAAAAATLVGVLTFRSAIKNAGEAEQALAQVRQGIESTGGAARRSVDDIVALTAAIQGQSLFGDEELQIAAANLLTFTNITETAFDRTLVAVSDISQRVGQDLVSTTIQLGKALNDPVANLGALSRTGIQFSDAQEEVIKSLAQTNRLAEAQAIILDELEKQYGGSARAARETFGGAVTAASNAWGDLLEVLGGPTIENAADEMNRLAEILQDPQTIANAEQLGRALSNAFEAALNALVFFIDAFNGFFDYLRTQGLVEFVSVEIDLKNVDEVKARIEELDEFIEKATRSREFNVPFPSGAQGGLGQTQSGTAAVQDANIEAARKELAALQAILDDIVTPTGDFTVSLEGLQKALGKVSTEADRLTEKELARAESNSFAAAEGLARTFGEGDIIKMRDVFQDAFRQALQQQGLSGRELERAYEAGIAEFDSNIVDEFDDIGPSVERGAEAGVRKGLDALDTIELIGDFSDIGADLFDGINRAIDRLSSSIEKSFDDVARFIVDITDTLGDSLERIGGRVRGPVGEQLEKVGGIVKTVRDTVNFVRAVVEFFKKVFGEPSTNIAQGVFTATTGNIAGLGQDKGEDASKNAKARDALIDSIIEVAQELSDLTGGAQQRNDPFTSANERFLNVAVRNDRKTGEQTIEVGYQGLGGTAFGGGVFDDAEDAFDEAIRLVAKSLKGGEKALVDYAKAAAEAGRGAEDILGGIESLKAVLDLAADPLSNVEQALKQIDDAVDPVIRDLESLGQSISNIQKVANDAARAVGVSFIRDIEDEILSFRNAALGEFKRILSEQEQLLKDAQTLLDRGAITPEEFDLVQVRNALQRQSFFEGLGAEQLESLGDFFGLIEESGGSIAVVLTQLTSAFSDFTDGVAETRDRLESEARDLQSFADQIFRTRDSIDLRFPSQSGAELLGELRGQLANARERAFAGDNTAFEQIPDLADRFVNLAREIFGSTSQFAEQRDFALGILDQTGGLAQSRADKLLSEIEALNTQVDVLNDIRDVLESPDPAVDLIKQQLDQGYVTNDLIRQLLEQYISLTQEARANALTPAEAQSATENYFGSSAASTGGSQQVDISPLVTSVQKSSASNDSLLKDVNSNLKNINQEIKRLRSTGVLTG